MLYDLHWLPLPQCIDYKILLLMFKSLNGKAPIVLKDLLIEDKKDCRSFDWNILVCPIANKTHHGECSFAHAAPVLWNKLPYR